MDFLGVSETEPDGELPVEPSLLLNTGSREKNINENVNKVQNNNKEASIFTITPRTHRQCIYHH